MNVSPLAGKLASHAMLVNVPRLVTAYYTDIPDPSIPAQRVAFGTWPLTKIRSNCDHKP
ncbi:hypothetical protein [Paraburkholderia aromaticivorans]|uniref:hypothetical protein n=1 Tax=Paraburkholderia aromaticivorans TaxID=2026199 RepID=UPI0038BD3AB4